MQFKNCTILLLLGLLAAEGARLEKPKSTAELVKKAQAETELATKEMELSKLLKKKAKMEPAGSQAAAKDEAAAKAAVATGAKALAGAKTDMAEASKEVATKEANAKKQAAGFMKKAKLETELAKKEIELSKELEAKAKHEPTKEAASKDTADAEGALAASAKAVEGAKTAMAEAKKAVPSTKPVAKKPVAAVAAKPMTKEDQLDRITQSLATLANLKNSMIASHGEQLEGQEMAEGAMTVEMGKDGAVWSTIMDMMKTAQDVGKKMKAAKNAGEKDKLMKSVEEQLNAKATKLGDITKEVDATDQRHGEEYLLGLLMQHQGKWNATEQLDVLKKFSHELPVAKELYEHHDASKPLAMQLGDLMDAEKKDKAAAKKAKAVFIQLASSLSH